MYVRRCGENLLKRGPQAGQGHCEGVRENTIASFRQAAAADVGFIEFDVQVRSLLEQHAVAAPLLRVLAKTR
jgi:hypothetical protein